MKILRRRSIRGEKLLVVAMTLSAFNFVMEVFGETAMIGVEKVEGDYFLNLSIGCVGYERYPCWVDRFQIFRLSYDLFNLLF